MQGIKCKFGCDERHPTALCPNIGKRKAKPDIRAIEAKAASAGGKKKKTAKR